MKRKEKEKESERTYDRTEFKMVCLVYRGIITEQYEGEELQRVLAEFDADMREVERLTDEMELISHKWEKRLEVCDE